jgi:hypothetical protein
MMDLISKRLTRFFRSFAGVVLDEERMVYGLVEGLLAAELRSVAQAVLKLVRARRKEDKPHGEQVPTSHAELPGGPFRQVGNPYSLLVFVPRSLESRLIDDATGWYGYSHLAIDLGEIDIPSGEAVMVESMMHAPVRRVFRDRYGSRPYVRIPLAMPGFDPGPFRECVLGRLGDSYDYEEALTWGRVHDPARQVCSDLAAECLPERIRLDIARKRREGALHPAQVSVQHFGEKNFRIFASPNALALYFGAPRGEKVVQADTLIAPRIVSAPRLFARRAGGWVQGAWTVAGLLGTAVLGWTVLRVFRRR